MMFQLEHIVNIKARSGVRKEFSKCNCSRTHNTMGDKNSIIVYHTLKLGWWGLLALGLVKFLQQFTQL